MADKLVREVYALGTKTLGRGGETRRRGAEF